jgi:hypothetical protein
VPTEPMWPDGRDVSVAGEPVMRTVFSVAAVVTGLLGVLWLFFPQFMLTGWGASQTDAITVYMSRRYGGLFFGYAVIMWLGRASASSAARAAILAGGAVVTIVLTLVSVIGVLSGVVGPAAWGAAVVEALLAAGFVYYYLTAR